jgi:hypothetical protein
MFVVSCRVASCPVLLSRPRRILSSLPWRSLTVCVVRFVRELFVLTPNCKLHRPLVTSQPFNSSIVLSRPIEWENVVSARFYVYPV